MQAVLILKFLPYVVICYPGFQCQCIKYTFAAACAVCLQLYNWYVQAMGTKVGKEVLCLGGVVAEYEHVSIGDGCVIGDGAFLLTHTVENRSVGSLVVAGCCWQVD